MPVSQPESTDHRAPTPARDVRALRALVPFFGPYRVRCALAALFLTLSALSNLAFPWALRSLIDRGLVAADPGERALAVREHFFVLFAVGCAFAVFSALRMATVTWIGERIAADVRNAVYGHVLTQSPAFFETTQTGEVLSRLTADTTLIQTVAGASLSMGLRSALVSLGAFTMLCITSPAMVVQVFSVLLAVVLPSLYLGRRVRKLSRDSQDRVADSSALAAEVLNAITVVQSYTQERRESERFRATTDLAFRTAVRRTRARAVLLAFTMTATSGALLFSLYRGTQAVLHGQLSAGQLGQTVVYAIILVSSVATLAEVYGDLLRAAGAAERLMELLASVPTLALPARPLPLPSAPRGSRVRFERVSFCYPSRPQHKVLTDFSLDVAPGQTVALVGPSGAGKSTLLQLLLRFYDANEGTVSVDGVPVASASLPALRSRLGIVPQETVLFSTSALENIRYGRPEANETEVLRAAESAYVDEFIKKLPDGYRTFLGERGVRLSGGQRQRIGIARAILKDPSLLLLDEATSALDAESEQVVQRALEQAMSDRTTIVIAHRLATVQRADRIVVMDAGSIVDTGTHAELIARGGLYARLAALQFATSGVHT